MIYHGGYKFEVPEEEGLEARLFDNGQGYCLCCGALFYSQGDDEVDADGHFYRHIEADYAKSCACTWNDLRRIDEQRVQDWMDLDGYGERLLSFLGELKCLAWIDEADIIRLSELAGKTFQELLNDDLDNLILWHVQAWAKHMQRMVQERSYA